MNKMVLCFLVLAHSFCGNLYAQETPRRDTIGKLQYHYDDAYNTLGRGVFNNSTQQEENFFLNYRKLQEDFFNSYLKADSLLSLEKGDTLRIWWKVYFDKSGKIDGIFYSIKTSLSDAQTKAFVRALTKFKDEYIFPQKSYLNFSQCGGTIFRF